MSSSSTAAKWSPGARLFELRKARERAHILEGLAVALANIDPIIAAIKAARTPAEAKEKLLADPLETRAAVAAMLVRTAGHRR